MKHILKIYLTGEAYLYADYSYDDELYEKLQRLSDEELSEMKFDEIDKYLDNTLGFVDEESFIGWSFMGDVHIVVVFDDYSRKLYKAVRLNDEEGVTYDPRYGMLRESYTVDNVIQIYDCSKEPIEVDEFHLDKLNFMINHYTVNEKSFETRAELYYDGKPLDCKGRENEVWEDNVVFMTKIRGKIYKYPFFYKRLNKVYGLV